MRRETASESLFSRTRFTLWASSEMLGFAPRPARETILDCAESLLASHPALTG
jgi:hypothetical protein